MRPAGAKRFLRSRVFGRRYRTRRYVGYALVLLLVLGLAVIASRLDRVASHDLTGVAMIDDGDTLTLRGQRIRLRGIDAPEFDQLCRKDGADYDCGQQSWLALQGLVGDSEVNCVGWERDRYGRLIAECRAGHVDLNRRLVESGWAVAYGLYGDAEAAARDAGLGIWAGEFDKPRDWRARHGGLVEGERHRIAGAFKWLRQVIGF